MFADTLKHTTLVARKNKDPMATFLVSVTSKALNLAKAANPQATTYEDEHALAAINRALKEAEDNLTILTNAGREGSDGYIQSTKERDLLKTMLPAEASDDDVRQEVTNIVYAMASTGEADPKKMMGPIMKQINEKFGASLNKKKASAIVQEVLKG